MGTYLVTGIIHRVQVSRRDAEYQKLSIELIEQALRREFSLENTIFSEDDKTFAWHIKPSMLEGNFAEFLQAQYEMYDYTKTNKVQPLIDKIKEAQNGEEIIALAKSGFSSNFQMVEHLSQCIQVERPDGFAYSLAVYYRLMAFFIDGKIIMECYDNILHYFEKNIRLQMATYPVVNCLKVLITE